MKNMKGKLVKKLKSIPRVLQMKPQDRVLQVNASDGYLENLPNISVVNFHKQTDQDDNIIICSDLRREQQQPEVIDVDELMSDLLTDSEDDKENITPRVKEKVRVESELKQSKADSEAPPPKEPEFSKHTPLSEIDISSFRRPDLDSGTLFDPGLLAAFQKAVIEYMRLSEAQRDPMQNIESNETEPEPEPKTESPSNDPLSDFEEKCPPGSFESVILYTTTLRGIRKTFDDCNSIRFLLESFRIVYFERDVSMHMEFRQELRDILDCKSVLPPKLFIKGRFIGGAEEVLTLHEQGKLRPLFAGVPLDRSEGPCQGCAGVRFMVCFKCNGSHKVIDEVGRQCPQCNENGLIICPYCC